MPTTQPPIPKRYYPRLSEVMSIKNLPEFLSAVESGLNSIFEKIHYKNLQFSKSVNGVSLTGFEPFKITKSHLEIQK